MQHLVTFSLPPFINFRFVQSVLAFWGIPPATLVKMHLHYMQFSILRLLSGLAFKLEIKN